MAEITLNGPGVVIPVVTLTAYFNTAAIDGTLDRLAASIGIGVVAYAAGYLASVVAGKLAVGVFGKPVSISGAGPKLKPGTTAAILLSTVLAQSAGTYYAYEYCKDATLDHFAHTTTVPVPKTAPAPSPLSS